MQVRRACSRCPSTNEVVEKVGQGQRPYRREGSVEAVTGIICAKMSTSKKNTTKLNAKDPVEVAIEQWHRERPDLDPDPMGILARVGRIEALKQQAQGKVFAEYGLNSGLFDVLSTLLRSGPPYSLAPSQLAAATMLTTGGMTGRLDKLEAAGWIQRQLSHEDRRMLQIKLTPAGYELINKVIEEHFSNGERLLSELRPSQRAQLARLLAACERSISSAVENRSNGRGEQ
jgi:DNA-binding MarR family transcriptional regulator